MIVRADTKTTATNGDYTISIANAATDLVIKETANDAAVTDITPNALSLKKVSIASAALTFSKNVLSAAFNAVVGTNNVDALDFNVQTNLVDSVLISELKFDNVQGGAVMDNTEVAGFNLYKKVGTGWNLIKSVGTNQLASQEVTFSNLAETVPANTLQEYKLTVDFVKDVTNATDAFKLRLSAYTAESTDQSTTLYDAAAETVLANGVIAVGEAGYAAMTSDRVITLVSAGSLTTDTDLTDLAANKDVNVVAGATSNFVAAFKMAVTNEPVKIKDFSIIASANPSASIDKIQIYGSDKTTLIAEMPVTATTTAFTNVSGFIMPVGTNNVYMKLVTRAIGKDLPGAQATDLTFTFDGVTVE